MKRVKIGWAQRDISTERAVNLPGQFQMRISRGTESPVTVTALAVDGDGGCAVFLSADLVAVRCGLLDEIKSLVLQKIPDFPADAVIMNATHTHRGGDHYSNTQWHWGESAYDDALPPGVPDEDYGIYSGNEYRRFAARQAADAVCEAWEKRSAGGISYGYGFAATSFSRRTVYSVDISSRPGAQSDGFMVDGYAKMYGECDDEDFSGFESGAEPIVNFVFTHTEDGVLTGGVVNVPCPAQCTEVELSMSADYWNELRAELRRRHGDIFILPQCAAAGDLSPRMLHYKKAQARRFALKYGEIQPEYAQRLEIAQRVADAFDEVYSWAKRDIDTTPVVKHLCRTVELEKRLITDEEYEFAVKQLAEAEKIPLCTGGDKWDRLKMNTYYYEQKNRLASVIKRYGEQTKQPQQPTVIHAVRIGGVSFVTNRFELYMDYMHRIQARSPFAQTLVVQLTADGGEDSGTYLATAKAAHNRGYSACLFCNEVSPRGGAELVEQSLDMLRQLLTT